jgi:WD40 repeat protein
MHPYIEIWNVKNIKLLTSIKCEKINDNIYFSSDDSFIIAHCTHDIYFWGIYYGSLIKKIKNSEKINEIYLLSNDNHLMICGELGTINICDIKTNKCIITFNINENYSINNNYHIFHIKYTLEIFEKIKKNLSEKQKNELIKLLKL